MGINKKSIFVFAEQVDNRITSVVFELLGKARELSEKLNAVVVAVLPGYQIAELPKDLYAYGAHKVLISYHQALREYRTEPYTQVIAEMIR